MGGQGRLTGQILAGPGARMTEEIGNSRALCPRRRGDGNLVTSQKRLYTFQNPPGGRGWGQKLGIIHSQVKLADSLQDGFSFARWSGLCPHR